MESKNFLCHVMAILIFQEQLYHIRGFEEEYSHPPRFAAPETFEMDFGNRWKALEELDRSQLGKFQISPLVDAFEFSTLDLFYEFRTKQK